ncbi:MAG: hypothetical protein WC091_02595 [Sulfuricellaceae bacterium]
MKVNLDFSGHNLVYKRPHFTDPLMVYFHYENIYDLYRKYILEKYWTEWRNNKIAEKRKIAYVRKFINRINEAYMEDGVSSMKRIKDIVNSYCL